VTDRLKISREKLAYIVDSTAAPVASIALVSTWIGYEVSLIADSLEEIGSSLEAYSVFLQSLPYNFYPILALVFGIAIAASGRDFGPMLRAERRARAGKLLADRAVPLADFEGGDLAPPENQPRRWYNAGAPVIVVLLVTFAGLWYTGRISLLEDGDVAGTAPLLEIGFRGIGTVFGAGNSFHSLLWGSLAGCLAAIGLAVGQRILSFTEGLGAWIGGVKSMTMAFVILVLSWSIADVCSALDTSGFMVAALSDNVAPGLLPALVFLFASATAFATGTSWGTMGILIPLAVPTAYGLAQGAGFDSGEAHAVLLGAVSAVLAGAIFGDHCSPISDTTVLSSMASGCDHVDHVRTQLPYALVVAGVAMLLGYLPAGFGVSPFICLLVGAAALAVTVRWVAHPVSD
jgi:Na+/H+ antiporter NhaC